MSARQQQFATKVQELIAASRQLTPQARKQVLEMLDAARRQIVAQLVSLNTDTFQAAQLRTLKVSIDQSMDQFARDAANAVAPMQYQAAQMGSTLAGGPLVEVGLETIALGQVNRTTLSIAQGYTADLITGLSRQSATKVNAAIQRAFLGGQSVTNIIAQIGRGLSSDGKFDGIFGEIGERAVSVFTNEVLRVHAMSAQARMEELAERHPDLRKRWRHLNAARIPRRSHISAEGQTKAVHEPFMIAPVLGAAEEPLMHPRDPNGSPQNTISCHCMAEPWFDPDALKATDAHRDVLKSFGISIQTAA